MLLDECTAGGVEVRTQCTIERVEHLDDGGFRLRTSQGSFAAPAVVVASGGPVDPEHGRERFRLRAGAQFGHEVLPTRAGLVPLTLTGKHAGAPAGPGGCLAAGRGTLQRRELPQLHAGHPPRDQRTGDPADLQLLATGRRPAPGPAAGHRCRCLLRNWQASRPTPS
jgi:hypothetical protein